MNKIISILTMLTMCLSLASCGEKPQPAATEVPIATEESSLIDTMTLEEKVGQILFVRCPETEEEVNSLMAKNPGGILMFQRDFDGLTKDDVISKIDGFQSASKIPLIIGVDEEGGTVVRVSANPNLAREKYKSPQDIYNEGGMEAVIANAKEKSELLLSLGINMNDAGIWSVLKHFPGYGEVTGDSHKGTVYNEKSAEDIHSTDLVPFKAGIDAGASCVLVSHNTVNSLDSENPASLSPVIHDILRSELGFDGVIMTDDIAMGAVADMENVYTKSVNAGNDLLITTDYETGYNQILAAVKSGEISMETLDSAVEHVLKLKGLI